MTHSGGKQHMVGDNGQQYEVSFFNGTVRQVYGWTNEKDIAQKMANCIESHPSWSLPWITDRWVKQ